MPFLLRVALPDRPGSLGAVATALGEAGADISAVAVVSIVNGRQTASRELAYRTQAVLANDPAAAREIGLQAVSRSETPEAQNAVRQAILADRATTVIRMSSVVLNNPGATRNGSLVAVGDENGVMRIGNRTGRVIWTLSVPFLWSLWRSSLRPSGLRDDGAEAVRRGDAPRWRVNAGRSC